MRISKISSRALRHTLDIATLMGGVVLLVAVSWEIITGDHSHFSHAYMAIQFIVCVLFLLDFFVRFATAARRTKFFLWNVWFLVISIPYLNLIGWLDLPRDAAMLIGIMPLLRAFLALYVVIRWFVVNKIRRLFAAYLFTVVLFTYISALIFFDYEALVNPALHGFGNALWWAWMNITTVGAAIDPVTAIGKVISVLLPILGMMMFPIFTTYILSFYQHPKR
ncbi:MAG: ion channel [Alistipes sp.]